MRVGLVAKGLLLKGDLDLELVLLCKDKPTTDLLEKVADNLGVQLAVSKTPGCLQSKAREVFKRCKKPARASGLMPVSVLEKEFPQVCGVILERPCETSCSVYKTLGCFLVFFVGKGCRKSLGDELDDC